MDRKKKCATSVKSFSGDDSGNTSDTKCQDRRKTGVVDSKSAAERTARISDAQKVSEAAGTSYISESRASAAKIQGPRRDFPKICTTTGSRGNPGKRTPATDAAKPKDLQVAPARAASLSPLCRGYTINPIVPSSRGDVISVAQAMHREKFGERVKELFDPEREAALKAIQTAFCNENMDEGTGSSVFHMYYYSSTDSTCYPFIYKGEGGNNNRFDSDKECMKNCSSNTQDIYPEGKQMCVLEPDPGMCLARMLKWYFDTKTKTCHTFIYGGCKGNGNNFETKKQCQDLCAPSSGRMGSGGSNQDEEPDGTSTDEGTIVGIIGGCMFIIALIAAISYFVIWRKKTKAKKGATKLEMA
ncbi:putative Kunitz-type serine protease inhibitor isoform X2 [Polypterus senegalus]|uniref:putative Kunitz-type serine protease inhibitor isoform X2 n=1 Tax=Polypterus senegalus TaxID=55291 RepID=UPI0019651D36|nr:putative Kunitz-type serine protease inhibitor isoform X2 [Polypterus senegalus]